MSRIRWFFAGLLTAQAVYLIAANTPESVVANLQAWWRLLSRGGLQ